MMAAQIPWTRIFPDADHRWMMGLRQGDLASYFADQDPTGAVLSQREKWFSESPEKYAVLLPEAEPAIRETRELAATLRAARNALPLSPREQLLELGRIWEPDLVWMHPGPDGVHRLVGGAVCFPSSWSLQEMLGRPMNQVHELVPGLNTMLARQIETFLGKLSPGLPWLRENWGLSRDPELNHHPTRPRTRLDATVTVDQLWMRLEHQLLLKLPASGSVLFGIRLEIVPFAEMLANREAAVRFERLLTTMSAEAATYKDLHAARAVISEMVRAATCVSRDQVPKATS